MLFGLEFKDLSKFFIRLDDVSLENIIPLKTEQEYTGWRFTFSNEVIWLPIGNVNDVLDYAVAFKLLSSAGLYNVFNDYIVYGDEVGLVNKVLSITDSNIVKNMIDNKNIDINLNTITPSHIEEDKVEKTKHIGIFFDDCIDYLVHDDTLDEVYLMSKGNAVDIAGYLFSLQMATFRKNRQVLCERVWLCNDLALIKFKIVRS